MGDIAEFSEPFPWKLNPVPALGGSARSSLKGMSTPRTRWALLYLLDKKDEVLAGERNPLVLQLDTFVETIFGIPVLR